MRTYQPLGKQVGAFLPVLREDLLRQYQSSLRSYRLCLWRLAKQSLSFNMPPDGTIFKAGKSIVQGLWEGISDMGAWLCKQKSGDFALISWVRFWISSAFSLPPVSCGMKWVQCWVRGIAAGLEDRVYSARRCRKSRRSHRRSNRPREVSAGFTATLSGVREGIMQNMQNTGSGISKCSSWHGKWYADTDGRHWRGSCD